MASTPEEIEQQLDAGKWLTIGSVATLLDIDRSTVDRMVKAEPPIFRHRLRPGTGGYRELHPEDVRRELIERRKVHGDVTAE